MIQIGQIHRIFLIPQSAIRNPNSSVADIRRLFDAEVLDFVKKGFVTDIEDFRSFASVPARFFENVGYDFFFNPIQRFFPDFFQG
jgi:hypothetical protein